MAAGRDSEGGEEKARGRAGAVDLYRQKKHKIDEICKAVGITRGGVEQLSGFKIDDFGVVVFVIAFLIGQCGESVTIAVIKMICAHHDSRSQSYSTRATPFPGFGNRTNTSGSCPGMINRGLLASCFIRSCAARFALASSVAVIGTCLSRFSYR
jgi:hypothetical protein